tara:strand:- start:433 stop:804 length:372 start_codon:yes stop_codon:yes gene_type:complete
MGNSLTCKTITAKSSKIELGPQVDHSFSTAGTKLQFKLKQILNVPESSDNFSLIADYQSSCETIKYRAKILKRDKKTNLFSIPLKHADKFSLVVDSVGQHDNLIIYYLNGTKVIQTISVNILK